MPVIYAGYLAFRFVQNRRVQDFAEENLTLTDIYLPVIPDESLMNITRLLWFELWAPENSFLKNLCFFPVKIIYILTLPYESNPLILFCSQFLVIFCGLCFFFLVNLNLLELPLIYSPVCASAVVAVLLVSKCFRSYKRHEGLVMNIFCFAISSAFNFFCLQVLKDVILFCSFHLE